MIVGSGIDLADVPRIRRSIERYGERFLSRVFTPAEIAFVERKKNRFERYAARFAAKEAAMKAIGTGWKRGVTWKDVEVTNLPSGKPTLHFSGKAAEFVARLGVKSVALSLSHTEELAIAEVILES
ncbi:MAG TPA: holo-[acyl-carrier-protein] synthase [Bryobacterales bacterium]|nr:holo-[acyl-carrier-protein] synthase [Bryobacterales bacterium]